MDLVKERDARHAGPSFLEDKETEYLIGRCRKEGEGCSAMHRIISGDPSKGVMAVDTELPFSVGDQVELFARPASIAASFGDEHASLQFLATGDEGNAPFQDTQDEQVEQRAEFLGASEHGFICTQGTSAQVCRVTGSLVSLNQK